MTERKQRRDMVRELGECVLEAMMENLIAVIRDGYVSVPDLDEAMKPHMAMLAQRIANSPEFQDAMLKNMIEGIAPQPRPTLRDVVNDIESDDSVFVSKRVPEALGSFPRMCIAEDCPRVGMDIEHCARKDCPHAVE